MPGLHAEPWFTRLRSRRGQALAKALADGTVRLQGEREWQFNGEREEVSALAKALPGVAERLSDSLVLLSFGNAVGYFDVPGLGRIEVVSGKWDLSHFEEMLRQLTEVAVNLPFSSGDVGALPYDRSVAVHEDVLYHAFVYLRHILLGNAEHDERLLPALQLVLRDPHRRFSPENKTTPLASVRQVTGRGLGRIMGGRSGMSLAGPAAAALPLARALRGHLPEEIEEVVVQADLDTPENRFAKAFLALCTGTLEGIRASIGTPGNAFERRVVAECDQMSAALRPILRNPLWASIGQMIHFPASSTVLQRRRGYRTLFSHWIRLRMATRIPLSAEKARDLLEVKDIAELYELWSFFSLVRSIEVVLGSPASAERLVTTKTHVLVPWDLAVTWSNGVRAMYNPRFSRSRTGVRHSYSMPLRPDIAISIPRGSNEGLHLLDAKFKVEAIQGLLEDGDEERSDDSEAERRGRFKRGDIYKMHAYRDAIPSARSVWILYPGTEFSFFSANGGSKVSDPAAVPILIEGVGAVPHTPVASEEPSLGTLIRQLVGDHKGIVGSR